MASGLSGRHCVQSECTLARTVDRLVSACVPLIVRLHGYRMAPRKWSALAVCSGKLLPAPPLPIEIPQREVVWKAGVSDRIVDLQKEPWEGRGFSPAHEPSILG